MGSVEGIRLLIMNAADLATSRYRIAVVPRAGSKARAAVLLTEQKGLKMTVLVLFCTLRGQNLGKERLELQYC